MYATKNSEVIQKQLDENAINRFRLFTLEYKPPYRPKKFPLEDEMRKLEFAIDHSYDAATVLVDTIFFIIITVIQIAAELADVMLLSPDLRAAEKDLKELISDYHFLKENGIHTAADLQANIDESKAQLSDLERERKILGNRIRRPKSSEDESKNKERRKAISKQMKPVRERLRRAEKILKKSPHLYELLKQEHELERESRDISRKVRSAHRIRGTSGEPLSQPPYGYVKSPENKKKWIIDPEAAAVVKDIFRMTLEGKGAETIARILQERKVLVPMAYWKSKGLPRGGKKTQPNPYKWCKTSVSKILAQQEYCGDIINFKTCSKSFKNKTRYANPEDKWMIFKDVHEPIIDREVFEQVQKLIGKTRRRNPKPENWERNMFCDLLYCADCGRKLWFNIKHDKEDIPFFMCGNHHGNRGTCSSTHYLRADAIEQW